MCQRLWSHLPTVVLGLLTTGLLVFVGRPPAAAPTTFADLPADTRTGIVSAMRAAQPIADSTALLLHDRTQQLAATVGEAETTISGRDGARVRFNEAALGRDAELHPLSGAVPRGLHTPQVRLSRSTGATAVEEWWRNSSAGIEQGFTLHTRPDGTGPLRLQQTITSTLTAHLTDGDTALRFSDGERERLRFGGLIAYDATGRRLPAVMRLTAHHLAFVVDDTDAVFPVVIDPTWTQQAYLKASNTGASDYFAYRVAVAGDTIVVVAYGEDSNGTGVNGGAQADNSAANAGAAYVFTRTGVTWSQQAYLKASNTEASDNFGIALAISGDTIVVGARMEDSNGTGVNGGAQADNSASGAGAAYAFSTDSAAAPTVTAPGAPTGVTGTAGNGQVSVAFTAPASNGGAAITGYTVTASPGGATATGVSSPLVVTGLTNGTAYTFTVTATNSAGTSVASSASAAVTPAVTPAVGPVRPSAPTWVGVRRHHLALVVDFAAPEVGFADTTLVFHVAVQDSARQPVATTTVSRSGSGVIIPYIKNEEAYWVTVRASNAAGEGPQAPWVLAAVPAWAFYPKDPDGRPCPSAVPCTPPPPSAAPMCVAPAADAGATPTAVTVARVVAATVGSPSLASSSQLAVGWCAAAAHHFEVVAREAGPSPAVRVVVAAPATTTIPTTVTLTGLKAKTVYTVTVAACATATCEVAATSAGVPGETETEYWQLHGTGSTVDRLATVVSDGHARLSATRLGPDAGAMAHRVQLYYAPLPTSSPSSLAVGVASAVADAATPDSYRTFTSRAGASGLIMPPPGAPLVATVAAGQGVPVARDRGALVRLFFEAEGADGRARILWVDSQDGYYGLDFHTGSATTCRTAADYTPGGGCAPQVAIAVAGDATGAGPMRHARQPQVAWPTLDAPHWDLSAGNFMVFTVNGVPGCADAAAHVGYAVWNGTTWGVSSRDHGCPTLLTHAQAASPVHRGGARYRLYYGDSAGSDGPAPAGALPFVGPKRLLYADGAVSGLPGVVDLDDWEPQSAARDIHFLWPTGDRLDARAEGYINHHHVLLPTGDPALQVMYLTITDGALVPIAAAALLRNP